MNQNKKSEGGTKEKILTAALKIFMEKGYEETSVRVIIDEAGCVVGSFYHYFPSKERLFEAVIERFLQGYAEQIAAIACDDITSFSQALALLLNACEQGVQRYFGALGANKLHWTVQYALHKRTLAAILPFVQRMVRKALADKTAKNPMQLDDVTLSALVLQGIEGILHAKPLEHANAEEMRRLKEKATVYTTFIMGIDR